MKFDLTKLPIFTSWALFLDIDGTLLDLASSPEAVRYPPNLWHDLAALRLKLDGALALITGRPLESVDRLLGKTHLPVAGLHGGEFRFDNVVERVAFPAVPDSWRRQAESFAARFPGVVYEEKRTGFGIHYRTMPAAEPEIIKFLTDLIQGNKEFHLLFADMLIEVRPYGIDKGAAIRHFMQRPPYQDRYPVFFGDDTTDQDGFAVVNELGGTAIQVGNRPIQGAAYRLEVPSDLRALLKDLFNK